MTDTPAGPATPPEAGALAYPESHIADLRRYHNPCGWSCAHSVDGSECYSARWLATVDAAAARRDPEPTALRRCMKGSDGLCLTHDGERFLYCEAAIRADTPPPLDVDIESYIAKHRAEFDTFRAEQLRADDGAARRVPAGLLVRGEGALPPGPYRLVWPPDQGSLFEVWGRQGTPPDFSDGWAIPLVARAPQSVAEWLVATLNAAIRADTPPPLDVERLASVLTRWAEISPAHTSILPTPGWFAAEYARLAAAEAEGTAREPGS